MFERINHSTTVNNQLIVDLAQQHLSLPRQKFHQYFYCFNTEKYDWIRNPFAVNAINSTEEQFNEDLAKNRCTRCHGKDKCGNSIGFHPSRFCRKITISVYQIINKSDVSLFVL